MAFNHGKLLAKFSQGNMLEKLEKEFSNSGIDNMRKEFIRGGICYMLSLRWLFNLFSGKGAGGALPPCDTTVDLAYYKQIAGDFCTYAGDFYKTVNAKDKNDYPAAQIIPLWTEQWNKKYIELCSKGAHTMEIFYKVWADCPGVPPALLNERKSAFLVNLLVPKHNDKDGFGHALALWSEEGSYFLFDPNFGVYVYTDPDKIAKDIFDVYASWYGGGLPVPKISFVKVV